MPIIYMGLRRRSAGAMIGIAWLVSVCICSPVFIQQFIDNSAINFKYCLTADLNQIVNGLEIANIIINFHFPLLIIVVCYSVIFIKIKQKIDQKCAAKMEQLEMMTCSTRLIAQVTIFSCI